MPKVDSEPAGYEDASWPDLNQSTLEGNRIRVAVADGASESLLAGRWARRLAEAACRFDPRALRRAARWAVEGWPAEVAEWLGGREPQWWQVEKLSRGAHATVAVLQLHDDGRWRAAAVGDSCVLHFSDGRLKQAFPLDSAAAFSSRTDLVNSAAIGACQPRHTSGLCAPGDQLVLATDALAMWLIGAPDQAAQLLVELPAWGDSGFARWADNARMAGEVRNDDLTLLVLEV